MKQTGDTQACLPTNGSESNKKTDAKFVQELVPKLIERQHPMNVDYKLLAEIKNQLRDDILYFGWLRQIVLLKHPHHTHADQTEAVVDAVLHLHHGGTIIVDHARVHDGTVLIDPWPEFNSELRARIESEIDHANERDRDFCFWIQLADHASKDQI